MLYPLASKIAVLLAPASQTNSATRTANLDCLGADYALITLNLASAINTNAVGPTINILESDNTTATNFATFNSNLNSTSTTITNGGARHYGIDLRSRKRYVRLSLTTSGTTNDNVTASATAALFRLEQPLAAGPAVASTNDVVVVVT